LAFHCLDFEHLKVVASVVEEGRFLRDWKRWDKAHLKEKKVPVRKVYSQCHSYVTSER